MKKEVYGLINICRILYRSDHTRQYRICEELVDQKNDYHVNCFQSVFAININRVFNKPAVAGSCWSPESG